MNRRSYFGAPTLIFGVVLSLSALPATARGQTSAPATTASSTTLPATRPANGRPIMDDLRVLFQDKKYPDVIRAVSAYQAATKAWTQEDDAYATDLLILKAEAILCTNNPRLAADCYLAAAKRAQDETIKSRATATALLIQRANGTDYTVRTLLPEERPADKQKAVFEVFPLPKPLRISILDLSARASVLKHLFYDELATAGIDTASRSTALNPLIQPCEKLKNLLILERAALGDETTVRTAQAVLRSIAARNVTVAMTKTAAGLHQLKSAAEQVVPTQQETVVIGGKAQIVSGFRKKGLTDAQAAQLQGTIAECERAKTALRELGDRLEDTAGELKPATTAATTVREQALAILTADYTNNAVAPPPDPKK